jgi:hypothetical protein
VRISEIDGYIFSLGIDALNLDNRARSDIGNLIHSTIYLIREAAFRLDYCLDDISRFSLDVGSLGGLIDAYHTHGATQRHDKVYALLGMSSDDLSKADLSLNYEISWEELLQWLVNYLFPGRISVETWGSKEIAVINTGGYILSIVHEVWKDQARGDQQYVRISLTILPERVMNTLNWAGTWTLPVSAKEIRKGYFVCLFHGASKPSVIRLHKDYFAIIIVAVPFPEKRGSTYESSTWTPRSLSDSLPSRNSLLVWNWEKSPEHS